MRALVYNLTEEPTVDSNVEGGSMRQPDVFDVLNETEAATIRANASTNGKRPYSPVTKALLEGQTVFLVGRSSYNTKTFTKLGKRLRTSRGQRNGRDGTYLWLEDIK